MEAKQIDYVSIGARLAIRGEGDYVNAYFAKVDTMEGALLLGSMRRSVCSRYPDLFVEWKNTMQQVMQRSAEHILGTDVKLTEQAAPLHERAGRA